MVGLSRVSIANIENGKQRVLLHDALAIGNLLGISLDSISQNRNEPNLRELLNMQGEDIKSNILSVLASIKKGDDDG